MTPAANTINRKVSRDHRPAQPEPQYPRCACGNVIRYHATTYGTRCLHCHQPLSEHTPHTIYGKPRRFYFCPDL